MGGFVRSRNQPKVQSIWLFSDIGSGSSKRGLPDFVARRKIENHIEAYEEFTAAALSENQQTGLDSLTRQGCYRVNLRK